jgi:hypothetical protein
MTITQILVELASHRPMSHATVYKHLRALHIRPVSKVRQHPQIYPDNTALLILKRLGVPQSARTHRNGKKRAA